MIDFINETSEKIEIPKTIKALEMLMKDFNISDKTITLILINDPQMIELKLEHWQENTTTDVLSFPAWMPEDNFMPPHMGDIFISLDVAKKQAQERNHSLEKEIALLSSHGITHIMGFDHSHAEGLGYEEGAVGESWKIFHDSWQKTKKYMNY